MRVYIGMGEIHDGVNFMRAACVIAIEKAQISFEPLLEVLPRLIYNISLAYLLQL